MKKIFSILLVFAMILGLAACGEEEIKTTPEDAIPEGCQLYYNLRPKFELTNSKDLETVKDASPDHIYMNALKTLEDMPMIYKDDTDGVTLQGICGGGSLIPSYTYKLYWDGTYYDSLTAYVQKSNGTLCGLQAEGGGILVVEVNSKKTRLLTRDLEDLCFLGFDSIIFTGFGTITLNEGQGSFNIETSKYKVPSLIIRDEVTVVADEISVTSNDPDCPAFIIMDKGGLECNKLTVNGDAYISSPNFKVAKMDGNIKRIVCREGSFSLPEFAADAKIEEFILSGSTVQTDNAIPSGNYTLGFGTLRFNGTSALVNGNITLTGGEIECADFILVNGDLNMKSGVINTTGTVTVKDGDALLQGGNILCNNGESDIVVQHGECKLDGTQIVVREEIEE